MIPYLHSYVEVCYMTNPHQIQAMVQTSQIHKYHIVVLNLKAVYSQIHHVVGADHEASLYIATHSG